MPLRVSESFFSLQGEGSTIGVPSVFLRLGGCNLLCGGAKTAHDGKLHDGATWRCDTIEVWLKHQIKTENEIISGFGAKGWLKKLSEGCHLIITGGEPLLQQEEILSLLDAIQLEIGGAPYVEIETNGTVMPLPQLAERVGHFNVSPKLANSGMAVDKTRKLDVLTRLANYRSIFKFVVSSEKDWFEISEIIRSAFIPLQKVYLMPAASSITELQERSLIVSQLAMKHSVNFSTRLQVAIWDKTTGV